MSSADGTCGRSFPLSGTDARAREARLGLCLSLLGTNPTGATSLASSAGGPGVGVGFALTTLSARTTLFLSDSPVVWVSSFFSVSGDGSGTEVSVAGATGSSFFSSAAGAGATGSVLTSASGGAAGSWPSHCSAWPLLSAVVGPLLVLQLRLLVRLHVADLHLWQSFERLPLRT